MQALGPACLLMEGGARPANAVSADHRDRCRGALTTALSGKQHVAAALEDAVFKLNSDPARYSCRIRGALFALRNVRLKAAVSSGACSPARLAAADAADRLPDLLDALAEEADLQRGLDLGRRSLPPHPSLLVLLQLGPRDVLTLSACSTELRDTCRCGLLWHELLCRDVLLPHAAEGTAARQAAPAPEVHSLSGEDRDVQRAIIASLASAPATPSSAVEEPDAPQPPPEPAETEASTADGEEDGSHTLVLFCRLLPPRDGWDPSGRRARWRTTRMLPPLPPNGPTADAVRALQERPLPADKRVGETWLQAYARIASERRSDLARAAARRELCRICDARAAEVRYHSRVSTSTVKYLSCSLCGGVTVLEASTGDVPVMGFLAGGK
jgi:hypothetical protein